MLNTKCISFTALLKVLPVWLISSLLSPRAGAQLPVDAVLASYVASTPTTITSPQRSSRDARSDQSLSQLAPPAIALHPKGKRFIGSYLEKNNDDLQEVKKRSAYYFSTIESIFRAKGLPSQLKYLAVIESELRTAAVSRVGAAGMWQLMPQTARELGLKVATGIDERRHFVKSTRAAAQYIKSLHAQFDDWLLVIAAYNCGAGNVTKAIKRGGSRDFWMIEQFLPAETRAHVKRYIGAHYYFQGTGSLATLTKRESTAYMKALTEYREALEVLQEIAREEAEDAALPEATPPEAGR